MTSDTLRAAIARFPAITLAEMDAVKLQVRVDTKYLFPQEHLLTVLTALADDYRVLEVDGRRASPYRSLYFDTPGRRHFHDHHNGRTFRSKVRFREYVGSGSGFLEVKRKTGRGHTDKARMLVPGISEQLSAEQQAFVTEKSGCAEALAPVLWNHFTRLTLVHRHRAERLTIDHDLRFSDPDGHTTLEGLCVAELKEQRADRGSPFVGVMRRMGFRPASLSKYCVGTVLLSPSVKYNTFKHILLRIGRLRRA